MSGSKAVLASVGLALLMTVPGWVPQATGASAPTLAIEVAKKADLVDGGRAAVLRVTTTCPAGAEVLEAFVYVNQDGSSTDFTGLSVSCDGQPHTSNVTVNASGFLLHRGAASASGYLLLTSGESTSPSQRLRLR